MKKKIKMNNNNILTLSCKWYINTFKNLPIIVLMKIGDIVGILATSPIVTFSRLVTHFYSGHNVHRFARGDCKIQLYTLFESIISFFFFFF